MTLPELMNSAAGAILWPLACLVVLSIALVGVTAWRAWRDRDGGPVWRACQDCGTSVYFPTRSATPSEAVCGKCLFLERVDAEGLADGEQSVADAIAYDEAASDGRSAKT